MKRILILLLVFMAIPANAQERALYIDLADDRVDITTGFNGTRVSVFGTVEGAGGDVVLTLKGPEKTMIVRRKGRVAGVWVNAQSMEFRRVPSYYDYAMATENDVAQVGVDRLDFYAEDEDDPAETEIFRDALIAHMQQNGLFPLKPEPLTTIRTGFFKAGFLLPPGVPTGIYTVEAYLVRGEDIIEKQAKTFQVGQVGFNAKVYSFAHERSFFYGLFAATLAVLSGWAAFTFLRRD
jgi:uncharacterized protein (TIGR02186 family)